MENKAKRIGLALISILSLALIAYQVWQYEITTIIGTQGLAWLEYGRLISPYIIILMVVVGYILPFLLKHQYNKWQVIKSITGLFLGTLLAYVLADILIRMMYSKGTILAVLSGSDLELWLLIGLQLIPPILMTLIFYHITKKYLSTLNVKQAIPFLPKRIGVVTSETGAVFHDIMHRIQDRFPCHVRPPQSQM